MIHFELSHYLAHGHCNVTCNILKNLASSLKKANKPTNPQIDGWSIHLQIVICKGHGNSNACGWKFLGTTDWASKSARLATLQPWTIPQSYGGLLRQIQIITIMFQALKDSSFDGLLIMGAIVHMYIHMKHMCIYI